MVRGMTLEIENKTPTADENKAIVPAPAKPTAPSAPMVKVTLSAHFGPHLPDDVIEVSPTIAASLRDAGYAKR